MRQDEECIGRIVHYIPKHSCNVERAIVHEKKDDLVLLYFTEETGDNANTYKWVHLSEVYIVHTEYFQDHKAYIRGKTCLISWVDYEQDIVVLSSK